MRLALNTQQAQPAKSLAQFRSDLEGNHAVAGGCALPGSSQELFTEGSEGHWWGARRAGGSVQD
eukprot:9842115-Alexandrium_andersonii.AAC.1